MYPLGKWGSAPSGCGLDPFRRDVILDASSPSHISNDEFGTPYRPDRQNPGLHAPTTVSPGIVNHGTTTTGGGGDSFSVHASQPRKPTGNNGIDITTSKPQYWYDYCKYRNGYNGNW